MSPEPQAPVGTADRGPASGCGSARRRLSRSLAGLVLGLALAGCAPSAPKGDDPELSAPDLDTIDRLEGLAPLLSDAPPPAFRELVTATYPAVPGGGHLPTATYRTRVELLEARDALLRTRTETRIRKDVIVREVVSLGGLMELGVLDSKSFHSPFGADDRMQFRIESLRLATKSAPPLLTASGETELEVTSAYAMWHRGAARDLGEIELRYRFRLLGEVETPPRIRELGIPGPILRIALHETDPDGSEVHELLWAPDLGAIVQQRIGSPVHTHVQLESWVPRGDAG